MTAKVSISGIVKSTGLTKAQVQYRLNKLRIDGEKVNDNFFIYDETVIKEVLSCPIDDEAFGRNK